ncbi:MAG: hypothetical protein HRU05_18100 [Oceanospirillaceae bacterium]|nr:hypothetical protein [Oceanospirillaceae bacterium]
MSYINIELSKNNVSAEVTAAYDNLVNATKSVFLSAFKSGQLSNQHIIIDAKEYYQKAPIRTSIVPISIERMLVTSGNAW